MKKTVIRFKSGWRTIGNKTNYYRSKWEANYARYLQKLKAENAIFDWLHEPKTFWFENIKRGVRSYLPDFQVFKSPDSWYWVEVKGYEDARSKTKIKRLRKYYPHETIFLVSASWFRENTKNIRLIIRDWE
jgi:hypothetical protein